MLARCRLITAGSTMAANVAVFAERAGGAFSAYISTLAVLAPTAFVIVFDRVSAHPRIISFAENWVGKLPGSILSPSALQISSARDAGLPPLAQAIGAEVLGAVPAVAAGACKDFGGVHLY